ncbi:hypothetical protein B296_00041574, partial [Ensete ventricosum]
LHLYVPRSMRSLPVATPMVAPLDFNPHLRVAPTINGSYLSCEWKSQSVAAHFKGDDLVSRVDVGRVGGTGQRVDSSALLPSCVESGDLNWYYRPLTPQRFLHDRIPAHLPLTRRSHVIFCPITRQSYMDIGVLTLDASAPLFLASSLSYGGGGILKRKQPMDSVGHHGGAGTIEFPISLNPPRYAETATVANEALTIKRIVADEVDFFSDEKKKQKKEDTTADLDLKVPSLGIKKEDLTIQVGDYGTFERLPCTS